MMGLTGEGASLVVHIEGGQGVLAGGVAVAVRQRAQLLQALGDRGGEAVLARHVRVQQDVLGRLPLVAAVGAPQLLHLQLRVGRYPQCCSHKLRLLSQRCSLLPCENERLLILCRHGMTLSLSPSP